MRWSTVGLGWLLAGGLTLTLPPVGACTIFTAAHGGRVLAGNNEDFSNPRTRMWTVPAENGKYGVVYFGFDDYFPQGGVNDRGLFFDGASVPLAEPQTDRKKRKADMGLVVQAMRECASVSEVLALFESRDLAVLERAQLLFADRTGDSAIVERNHVIRRRGSHQISTNFRQSRVPPEQTACPRYRTATRMLAGAKELSIDLFRSILEATHQEGPSSTLYSNVYDLQAGVIHLYLNHDFSKVVRIDVKETLAKGRQRVRLSELRASPIEPHSG